MNLSLGAKHYIWAANLLVLGLVIWTGVGLVMSVVDRRLEAGRVGREPASPAQGLAPRALTLADYEAIARHNIFNPRAGKNAPESPAAKAAPARRSAGNLKLKGVIYNEKNSYAAAILEDGATKEQDLYRAGDRIGPAEVVRVGPDWVTIREGGQETKLRLSLDEGPVEVSPLPEGEPQALPWSGPETEQPSSGEGEEPIAQAVGPGQWLVSRETLARHMGDLNYFLSNVLIKPHFQDGKPAGFQVASVKNGSPVHLLGFQRGDVIKKVNGVLVANPEDLVNMYHQVQQMETITVDVERSGQELSFTYTLK
ncbi:MAG: type II secretion system protein GspC [Thermodesulfobacteriota bacterium]